MSKYTFERRSQASLQGWAARRARGTDKHGPEKNAAIQKQRLQTMAANRKRAREAMTPDERREAAAKERRSFVARARAGWVTRRARLGLPPGPSRPTFPTHLYIEDRAALAALAKTTKDAVHRLVALAVEVGVLVVDGGEAAHGPQEPR